MNLPVLEQLKASWLLLVSALQALVGGSESVVSFEWQQPLLLLLLPPLLLLLHVAILLPVNTGEILNEFHEVSKAGFLRSLFN